MPVQTTQATLAGIGLRLQNVEKTLKEILAKVSPTPSSAQKPVKPRPKRA